MSRWLATFLTAGLESLFSLGKLPTPISYPLIFVAGVLMQSIGLLCQASRWLLNGGKRYGQGDSRILRTPDSRFEDLEGYPFAANYFEHDGVRLHYIDEGKKDASDVVLLIHGMPAWSYCYRKVVPTLVAEGYRVLALDFCGCGKSDKPVDASKITFASHVASIPALVKHIGLKDRKLTLVIHDWGSLIGQTALPTLGTLKRLVLLNAFSGPGLFGTTTGKLLFAVWQGLSKAMGRAIPVGELNVADAGGPGRVSVGAEKGYGAPFPGADYKALMANWPQAYGDQRDVIEAYTSALDWAHGNLAVPVLLAFGEDDQILELNSAFNFFCQWLKKAPSIKRVAIPGAGHFPMESQAELTTDAIRDFMRTKLQHQ